MATTTLQPIRSRQKVAAAQRSLRDLAFKLGANNKLPTVREMCRALGISAVTIEHVLSGLEEQGVILRRPGSGIYVSPRLYQKNVGLVFGQNAFQPGASPFCAMLVEACQKRAREHNDNFSFYLDMPAGERPAKYPVHADLAEAIERKRIDGMLLVARHSAEQEKWLREQGVPLITFCGGANAPFAPMTVGFDLKELAGKGLDALLAKGSRRIAAITAGKSGAAAFRAVMEGKSLGYEAGWNLNPVEDAPPEASRFELGYQAMRQLLAGNPAPDGVMVFDDMLACGAVRAVKESGLAVGADVLIATHCNRGSAVLQHAEEGLVLVEVDLGCITEAMFQGLEQMMANGAVALPAIMVPLAARVGSGVQGTSK